MAVLNKKQLLLNVGVKEKQVRAWLTLSSGIRGFTTREIDVLEVLLLKRQELVADQIKGKNLSELLFSTSNRKIYIHNEGITDYNFTNIFSSIKKKGAIVLIDGNYEDIDDSLIPADEITIKLVYKDA